MTETNGSGRRERIVELLREAHRAITGSELSVTVGVSRQAIVNDMAILRAAGEPIGGSPRGYHWDGDLTSGVFAILTCAHDREGSQQELETLVAHGITVHDVATEHPLYGEVRADLMISSHRDVARYAGVLHSSDTQPLSSLTDGVHRHRVRAPDDVALASARGDLALLGLLHEG
jgi:transcriptional regulator of NAD metabolism